MASRSGPRATGSDGSDFQHREKVANHYKESAEIKNKIKKSLLPHMLLAILAFVRFAAIASGSNYFRPLESWEVVWLLSGISAYIGYGSLVKNDIPRLLAYLGGNFLFGVVPLGYGTALIVSTNFGRYKANESFSTWQHAPMNLALIAVCIQVQLVGLYHGVKLLKAWRSKRD